jgi:hypothetical protein
MMRRSGWEQKQKCRRRETPVPAAVYYNRSGSFAADSLQIAASGNKWLDLWLRVASHPFSFDDGV